MKLFITCAIILVCILLFCLIENIRELHTFRVVHHDIKTNKLKKDHSVSLIFISDLHNHQYGMENKELLDEIKSCRPDLILIGGDLIIRSDETSYEKTFPFLRELIKIAPVYFANGNHEQKLKEFPEEYALSYQVLEDFLSKEGIFHLVNKSESFERDNDQIKITGLEIPVKAYRYFGNGNFTKEEMESLIDTIDDPVRFHILLAHNPMFMELYKEWNADLILSGHLHGGIVRIPLLGGLIAPNFVPFPKYSGGIFQEKDQTIVVSNGLGTHSVPVRINCSAELIHLTIHNK